MKRCVVHGSSTVGRRSLFCVRWPHADGGTIDIYLSMTGRIHDLEHTPSLQRRRDDAKAGYSKPVLVRQTNAARDGSIDGPFYVIDESERERESRDGDAHRPVVRGSLRPAQ
jgi:hypothetical protein